MSEALAERIAVERSDGVAVVRMRSSENRSHPDNLDAIFAALDEIEGAEGGPAPLVLTGEGKFFSNGLDLEWMGQAEDGERKLSLGRVHGLFARILTFPSFTVAAINGHAFAAGAMLALACDQRVMREDRGFFCLPEVDLGIPFTAAAEDQVVNRATERAAAIAGKPAHAVTAIKRGLYGPAVEALAADAGRGEA